MTEHIREEIKRIFPKMWEKRNKSRDCAIRLFCLECVAGNLNEVKACSDKTCPLYQWRMKTNTLKASDPHFNRRTPDPKPLKHHFRSKDTKKQNKRNTGA